MLLAMFCSLQAASQRDNIWYFGIRAGLDFSSGSPVALTDNQISTYEGVSTICKNGQLLFYTNGVRVLNRNHGIMPNGTGLEGGTSSTQSALIIANPANPDRYYIFTADEFVGSGIHYSEVDMTANNGLGDVITKNVPMLPQACEKLNAVSHTNGTDVWLIAHEWNTNAFYAWRVGIGGISAPVISNAGSVVTCPVPFIAVAGQMKISPDGSKIAMANATLDTQLFDFDPTTGVVSNARTLMTGYQFGIEFSPSGNALYVSQSGSVSFNVFQFDLNATDIIGSMVQISNPTAGLGWGMLDIAPDSKIYIATYGSNLLSVINHPDVIGSGCNLTPLSVNLAGRMTYYGLPTYFQPGIYITDILSEGSCSGSSVVFSADITSTPDVVRWDFGDGNFSNDIHPLHTYMLPGVYTVKLKISKNGFERYFSETITINPNPIANPAPDIERCDDVSNDGREVFDLSLQNAAILGTQSPFTHTVTYHISQDDANIGLNPIPVNYANIFNPQRVYARVTVGQCFAVTSFTIRVVPKPVIDMPLHYWICGNNSVTITAPQGFESYLWSTLQTTRSISVTDAGIYTLTVRNGSCESSVTITVGASQRPVIKDVEIQDWTDTNNSITVFASGTGDYEYSLDGTNYQPNPVFNNLLPGIYTIYVNDRNGCGAVSKQLVLLMYPKFFTPNDDGTNDMWAIKYAHFEPQMKIHIFDRYGKVINSFKGSQNGWDGTFEGNRLPSADYWFVVTRSNGKEYRGHFSMVR